VTVLAEVYDNRDTPSRLLANVTVSTPTGDVVRRVPAVRESNDQPWYTASLPMEGLAPGKYVLVMDARAAENAPPRDRTAGAVYGEVEGEGFHFGGSSSLPLVSKRR